jgi:hypothetical protein
MKIAAPSGFGYHEVAVCMAGDDQVIDASLVLVRHEN